MFDRIWSLKRKCQVDVMNLWNDGEVDVKGEGTLRDAYWRRQASNYAYVAMKSRENDLLRDLITKWRPMLEKIGISERGTFGEKNK